MSQMAHGMGQQQPQLEVYHPDKTIPTFFANIVQTQLFEEEVYLDFCVRSAEKPMVRADLQCRVITTVNHLRRLVEGWNNVLAQLDQLMRQREQQMRMMGGGGGGGGGGLDEGSDMAEEVAPPVKGKKRPG